MKIFPKLIGMNACLVRVFLRCSSGFWRESVEIDVFADRQGTSVTAERAHVVIGKYRRSSVSAGQAVNQHFYYIFWRNGRNLHQYKTHFSL